jgi:hypothetical protein
MNKLDFYRKCYEDCKLVIADLYERKDLPEERKMALIDKMLDKMNELKALIEEIEEFML